MQQDPQNDRYYHNQLYPEAQKENHSMNNDVEQLSNNDRVDQQRDHQNNHIQRQRNSYHQLHPHYGPYLEIQENAQQHLTQQNQQRIHEHGQMNQMHQRDHQPHHQLLENDQQHHQNPQNQQQKIQNSGFN
ncbi:hypothetical protein B9Z55_024009 [Caenorhabditis nigoni]|uniref:Uncharacterized protein n=1 Tax=Caenorhabditis nigoni TaxID=1611254 RepID=A0A2G5SSK3_9PELO|nr:hypothetical protein B9Z55_024009 [Caenorhabditis nigoni]